MRSMVEWAAPGPRPAMTAPAPSDRFAATSPDGGRRGAMPTDPIEWKPAQAVLPASTVITVPVTFRPLSPNR